MPLDLQRAVTASPEAFIYGLRKSEENRVPLDPPAPHLAPLSRERIRMPSCDANASTTRKPALWRVSS